LELDDHWILVWRGVSVCYLAGDPVELIVAISKKEKAFLLPVIVIATIVLSVNVGRAVGRVSTHTR